MKHPVFYKVLIVSLVALFALGACGPSVTPTPAETTAPQPHRSSTQVTEAATAAPGGETITVIFPKHEADIKGAFEARIKQFEANSGITVNLIQSDWDSVANRVTPELATGGSAYDVVEFDNGWVAQWCGAGWATPLNDFMSADYTNGMIPGLVDLFTCPDGKLYGLVWNNDTRFFHYNAAKLQEAGFTTPPATWGEFTTQSLAAREKGVVKYGFAPFWNQEWSLGNEFHFWDSYGLWW